MRYVVVDLEATCWEGGVRRGEMEIIEIGAVELAGARGPVMREFCSFVRPVANPVLSDFCCQLTTIRQADVDAAQPFPEVLQRLHTWIGTAPSVWCSWGQFDLGQMHKDCRRHGIPMPPSLEQHNNLKRAFSDQLGLRRGKQTMMSALRALGLHFDGTHHRALDDARNIARIAMMVLPVATTAP